MRKFVIVLFGFLLIGLLTQCPFTMEPREYSFCMLNNYSGKSLVAVVSTEYPNTSYPNEIHNKYMAIPKGSNIIETYYDRKKMFKKYPVVIILLYDNDDYHFFRTPIDSLKKGTDKWHAIN